MKKLSQLFVLTLALMLPVVQAGAAELSVKAAIDSLHAELAATRTKDQEAKAADAFMGKLVALEKSGMSRTEIVRQ
ncbi:MAG: hypothetical protein EOP04_23000, partial [Proteobacteria bacterium]